MCTYIFKYMYVSIHMRTDLSRIVVVVVVLRQYRCKINHNRTYFFLPNLPSDWQLCSCVVNNNVMLPTSPVLFPTELHAKWIR